MTKLISACAIVSLWLSGCGSDPASTGDDDGPGGPQCSDGVDNDSDGTIDFPDDLGCESSIDDSEDSPRAAQCSDHRDNDGDGKVDFPNDPGCFDALADDETDDCPDGAGCPQCGNGRDDDFNGKIDFPDDPGCTSAADTIEFTDDPVACGTGLTIQPLPGDGIVMGTFDGSSLSQLATECGGGSGAPAFAYTLILSEPKVVVASTEDATTTADTVIDIRSVDCDDPNASIACNDDVRTDVLASKVSAALAPGVYYILVEGHDSTVTGTFKLTVEQFAGEGSQCAMQSDCGPGLVCRIPVGGTELVCSKPVCSDGVDDDGDGKADFPDDPGCADPGDGDEVDDCPSGPNCPACSNGIDDDGDGLIDYPLDPTCGAASGFVEGCDGEQEPIVPIASPADTGTLAGAHDDHDPSCGGNGGLDVQYSLTIPAMKRLVIDTEGSAIDTVLSLRPGTCSGADIECDDDGGDSPLSSKIELADVAAGNYVVAVDGFDDAEIGSFNLDISGVIAARGSCEGALFASGAFTCDAGFSCDGPAGARTCRTACSDGLDNNGDGKIDFPDDPGCTSLADDEETTVCPGALCPACADLADNDGDGLIDFPLDTSCLSASGTSESCAQSEPIVEITMPVTTSTTVGQTNDFEPTCASSSGSAADVALQIDLPDLASITFDLDTPADAVLVLMDATCAGAELACRDGEISGGETLVRESVAAGRYFVIVDGFNANATGAFSLTTSGTIAPGGSCESPLFTSGVLACAAGFVCDGPAGAKTCRTECSDGEDNNGDGKTDFPDDPGCTSPADNSEDTVCPGASCPQCSDGIDNDGDGEIDFGNDPNCDAASDDLEEATCEGQSEPIAVITTPTFSGTTAGATDDIKLSCASSSTTASAPDVALQLDLPPMQSLSLDLSVGFDSVHALLDTSCAQPELVCRDPATLDVSHVPAGRYFLVVDGFGSGSGAFTLTTSGVIEAGGSCESPLFASGAFTCAGGLPCSGPPGGRSCFSECSDGVDNNGDGQIDFPNDPACTSPLDATEEVLACPGAGCPACADGVDNDADGEIDFPLDFGCTSAAAASEAFCPADTDFGGVIAAPSISGTLAGATDNFEQSCQSSTGNDRTYSLQLPVPVQRLVIDTLGSATSDTVLSLKDAACGAELACDDDGAPGSDLRSLITVLGVPAGNYAINVDSFGSSNNGAFTLNVKGTLAAGTACTSSLFASGVLVCAPGTTCTAGVCQ